MGRKPIGEHAMSEAERQRRQRAKARAQRELARELIDFVRFELAPPLGIDDDAKLSPESLPKLYELQRRIRELHPI
jgi:dsDNA-specific endonuclease/ATPase MutS2